MKVILVTGANGFIGKNLIDYLKLDSSVTIKTISRESKSSLGISYEDFMKNNYNSIFFDDVTHVIHLAAIAHQFGFEDQELLDEVNVKYPSRLLEILKYRKLKRFIFLSSVAVSLLEKGIVMDTKVYAETKKRAENALYRAQQGSEVEVDIIRPPMVYGPKAPGNFAKLIKLLRFPLPLPFGKMAFHKPAIHVSNLVSAIGAMVFSQNYQRGLKVYELADPFKIEFSQYLKNLNTAVGGKALIFPLPLSFLRFFLKLIGKRQLFEKLVLTYSVSNDKFEHDFDWPKPIDREKMFINI